MRLEREREERSLRGRGGSIENLGRIVIEREVFDPYVEARQEIWWDRGPDPTILGRRGDTHPDRVGPGMEEVRRVATWETPAYNPLRTQLANC